MDCAICIEPFNNSNRKKIKCDFCEFESCSQCVKKYILDVMEYAHCMNCRKLWDRKLVLLKLGPTFLDKQYKSKTENLLFEKEKAMLPATQVYVEREIEAEKINEEIKSLEEIIRGIHISIDTLLQKRNDLLDIRNTNVERKRFIKPCKAENCKGFLSTHWKCGICNKYTCNECLEIKEDDEHKCEQHNLESAKLIMQETKNCPSCGVNIFKTEGCDQMFCTQCHTPFSWKTGKIETGNVHNPHYFEWLRKNNKSIRNQDDFQCGREINNLFSSELTKYCRNIFDIQKPTIQYYLLDICRCVIHVRHVDIPRFTIHYYQDNLSLRKEYMRDLITEDNFKRMIRIRDTERQKKNEISQVLNMFVTCSTDILFRCLEELKEIDKNNKSIKIPFLNYLQHYNGIILNLEKYRIELNELLEYSNQCLSDISKTYKCKLYKMDHKLGIN